MQIVFLIGSIEFGMSMNFEDQDFLDLAVLFNLSWFGYGTRVEYPLINALESKGRNFNEDEKVKVLDIQVAAMRRLFPMYRRLYLW